MKLTEKLNNLLEGMPKSDWEVQFDKDVANFKFPKEVKGSDRRQFLANIQKIDLHTKGKSDSDKASFVKSLFSSVPGYFQPLLRKHAEGKK